MRLSTISALGALVAFIALLTPGGSPTLDWVLLGLLVANVIMWVWNLTEERSIE